MIFRLSLLIIVCIDVVILEYHYFFFPSVCTVDCFPAVLVY